MKDSFTDGGVGSRHMKNENPPHTANPATVSVPHNSQGNMKLPRSFSEILAGMPEGFVAFSPIRDNSGSILDYECTFANQPSRSLFEHSVLLHKRLRKDLPGFVQLGLVEKGTAVFEKGSIYNDEIFYNHYGTGVWLNISIFRFQDGFAAALSNASCDDGSNCSLLNLSGIETEFSELDGCDTTGHQKNKSLSICDVRTSETPVVFVNGAFEYLTGYTREEVKGKNPGSMMGPDARSGILQTLRAVITTGQTKRVALKCSRKNGTSFWNEVTVFPVLNKNGTVTDCILVHDDVTKQRDLEQELVERTREAKRLQEKLKNQARTLDETRNRLHQYQKLLSQSEKLISLGQLTAGIAHEINNPIAFVASNLSTLSDYVTTYKKLLSYYEAWVTAAQEDDPDARENARKKIQILSAESDLAFILQDVDLLIADSLKGCQRVKELAQSLTNYTRSDTDTMVATDINKEIDTAIRMLWNQLKYRYTVKKKLGQLPPVQCNPGQIGQVLTNIIVNAIQAMPEGGELTLETSVVNSDVSIRIRDTGIGIAPESIPGIFKPFFTTKPAGSGTGLGLSICYSIIEKHNGRIEVESEPGSGTTFTVFLPVSQK